MQRSLTASAAAFAAMMVCVAPALSQNAATTGLPKAPVPYTQIRAKPARTISVTAPRPASSIASAAPAPDAEALDPVRLEAFLDGWMSQGMAREHVAGAAVTIVQNGQVILAKGFGVKEFGKSEKVDEHTLFAIASIV